MESFPLLLLTPRVRLVTDRDTGKLKGFGFCEFMDLATAESAKRNLNGREYNGRTLRVDLAEDSGAGGGGGGKKTDRTDPSTSGAAAVPIGYDSPLGAAPASAAAQQMAAAGMSGMDAVTAKLAEMSPAQLFNVMNQLRSLIQQNHGQARQLLAQNPQLTLALFQAQLTLGMTKPPSPATTNGGSGGGNGVNVGGASMGAAIGQVPLGAGVGGGPMPGVMPPGPGQQPSGSHHHQGMIHANHQQQMGHPGMHGGMQQQQHLRPAPPPQGMQWGYGGGMQQQQQQPQLRPGGGMGVGMGPGSGAMGGGMAPLPPPGMMPPQQHGGGAGPSQMAPPQMGGGVTSQQMDQQQVLLQQVMTMTPEQISLLPPDQRQQVELLRQLAGQQMR